MSAIVRIAELDVNARLRQLGLTRDLLIDVLRACVQGYGDCTDNDPPTAKGYESWRWGTRHFRELLLPGDPDWQKNDAIPSVRNAKLGIRVIVLNADDETANPDPNAVPTNRSPKGVLHERAIKGEWLPGLPYPYEEITDEIWYFCNHVRGDQVLAELSCPQRIEGGFIVAWKERIIIVRPGEWGDLASIEPEGDVGPDIDFDVRLR